MDYLEYDNYLGSVEFDKKEHCLKGRVQGLREESLNYKGQTLEELEKSFKEAVNKYVTKCLNDDQKPKKSYGGPLNVRLGPDLHGRAAAMAERMDRTLNSIIKEAVEMFLYEHEHRQR